MWVLGGINAAPTNAVWSSSNGSSWTFIGDASFSSRFAHSSVVFNNEMWVIFGEGADYLSDVWHSP